MIDEAKDRDLFVSFGETRVVMTPIDPSGAKAKKPQAASTVQHVFLQHPKASQW